MYLHEELTDKIIRCFYNVYNGLGYGFLEKVYENALLIELRNSGLVAENQVSIKVYNLGLEVGNYYADILVGNKVILELKAGDMEQTIINHELQLTNYLKATNYEVGLLLLFGIKPQVKRKIFSNDIK
ncbi:MAG: GxxExxY protein [Chitinophagaceae bacterium]|nr:GxxExxY protein [Chitinophagaceae bacterium]